MAAAACQIEGIEKSFGPNRVLRKISIDLPGGQITVLMGANGAGKSTLVKILCGAHSADAGHVRLFGERFAPSSPADAFQSGVVTVHQNIDDGVIPDLDVASNLLLDRLASEDGGLLLNRRELRKEARKVAASMQLDLDVDQPVRALGVADRQMIAIARAMARKPKLLILDEPTSSLSATEAGRLFELLERLRDTGVAILYISHRMSDIRRLADRIVTMRDGQISGTFTDVPLDYEGAVTAMLGQKVTQVDVQLGKQGDEALRLHDVRLSPDGPALNLTVHHNEVVAITGLLGSGKSALASLIFGLETPVSGRIALEGRPYAPKSPREAIRAGVFMCPKDRGTNAVIPDFDISDNIGLPFYRRYSSVSFLSAPKLRRAARGMIETLGIVCQSETDDVTTLSGGNQQKVMVGRWLSQPCNVLVLDEPFQGVDIRARRDIGNHIRETAKGRATIVFVAELDEALELADRIIVLHEQEITGEHINEAIDMNALLSQFSGSTGHQASGQPA